MLTTQQMMKIHKSISAFESLSGKKPTVKELSETIEMNFNKTDYRVNRLIGLGMAEMKGNRIKLFPVLGDLESAIDFAIRERENAKRQKRNEALHPDMSRQIRELAGI